MPRHKISPKRFSTIYIVEVNNRSRSNFCKEKIGNLAKAVFKSERIESLIPIELSISLVSGQSIGNLNRKFHAQNKATDVLAFPIDQDPPRDGIWAFGEVVVCPQRARVQARIFGSDFRKEVARYIVHGLLHLLGYRDHTRGLSDKMWKKQEAILDKFYRGI